MPVPEIVIALNGANPVACPESPADLSEDTRDRVDLAMDIALDHEAPFMASVGRGATAMALHAQSRLQYANPSRPTPKVLEEHQSYETIGNAHHAKLRFLEPLGLRVVRVVTADYHKKRAEETWKRVLGDEYDLTFTATHPDLSVAKRVEWWTKERVFTVVEGCLVMSSLGFNRVKPSEDARREQRIERYHPRSPDSIWRKFGVKPLADRVS